MLQTANDDVDGGQLGSNCHTFESRSQIQFSTYSTLEHELEGHLILRKVSQEQQSGRVLRLFNLRAYELEGHLILREVFQKQQSGRVLRLFNLKRRTRRTPHFEESIPGAAVRSSCPPIQP
ncbi:hypothetical protein CEXT_628561 [Caerostris extrusa]|uniref:Uncharacterized protein n=1 Tax=Caerostris extrusa TaxID=172846 RepID=A0AAV4U6P2_CAEEX|nr:hypothetical protein CEXT_628561 [Caerostris extrusa]